jgi:hypothetical protein
MQSVFDSLDFLVKQTSQCTDAFRRICSSTSRGDEKNIISSYAFHMRNIHDNIATLSTHLSKKQPSTQDVWTALATVQQSYALIHNALVSSLNCPLDATTFSTVLNQKETFDASISILTDALSGSSIQSTEELLQYYLTSSSLSDVQYGLNLQAIVKNLGPLLGKKSNHAYIGGFAVLMHLCHGKSLLEQIAIVRSWRGTKDIDVLMDVSTYKTISHCLQEEGLHYQKNAWRGFELHTYTSDDFRGGARVQIQVRTVEVFEGIEMQDSFLRDAKQSTFLDVGVRMVSKNHLRMMKLSAGRVKDHADIDSLKV